MVAEEGNHLSPPLGLLRTEERLWPPRISLSFGDAGELASLSEAKEGLEGSDGGGAPNPGWADGTIVVRSDEPRPIATPLAALLREVWEFVWAGCDDPLTPTQSFFAKCCMALF